MYVCYASIYSNDRPFARTDRGIYLPVCVCVQHDSVVSPSIAYDLLLECKSIGEGLKRCPELLGEDVVIEPIESKVWHVVPMLWI